MHALFSRKRVRRATKIYQVKSKLGSGIKDNLKEQNSHFKKGSVCKSSFILLIIPMNGSHRNKNKAKSNLTEGITFLPSLIPLFFSHVNILTARPIALYKYINTIIFQHSYTGQKRNARKSTPLTVSYEITDAQMET